MTARQILDYTAHFFFRGPQSEIDARVAETLELVGLSDKADRPIKGFSGGERQRVGIAQAQVNYPDLLILDEPAASLDPMGRHDVLEVMERLREHTTIFYCTHILDDVQRVSDTVAILNRGQLIASGPIAELLSTNQGGVAYEVGLKGPTESVYRRVAGQPWVTGHRAGAGERLDQVDGQCERSGRGRSQPLPPAGAGRRGHRDRLPPEGKQAGGRLPPPRRGR